MPVVKESVFSLMALALGLTMGQTAAHATPIIYQYAGQITAADPTTGVAPGTQFSGVFTYDPGSFPSDYLGMATYPNPFTPGAPAMTFAIGGQDVLNSLVLGVTVSDSDSPKLTFSGAAPSMLDGHVYGASLELLNPSGIDFGVYGPTGPVSLTNFSEAILNVTWPHDDITQTMFSGVITSLTATTVPEPGSATLFCFAAVGCLAYVRRRRTRGDLQLIP